MKEHNEEPPVRRPEEMQILDNLDRITAIDNRTQQLREKIRCNPLNFMGVLVWEVELERLAHQKDSLQKRNEKLDVSNQNRIKNTRQQKPCSAISFSPIPIIALARYTHQQFLNKMNMEKEKTEDEQLEELNNLRLPHTERTPERIRWPETTEQWNKLSPDHREVLGQQHEREDYEEYKAIEAYFPEIREAIQRHEQDLDRDTDDDFIRDDDDRER